MLSTQTHSGKTEGGCRHCIMYSCGWLQEREGIGFQIAQGSVGRGRSHSGSIALDLLTLITPCIKRKTNMHEAVQCRFFSKDVFLFQNKKKPPGKPGVPSNTSVVEDDMVAADRFKVELQWCVQQLEASMRKASLKESMQVLFSLLHKTDSYIQRYSKTPII